MRRTAIVCECEFEADPADAAEDQAEPWHFKHACKACGCIWFALHCEHDGHQRPCPACNVVPAVVEESA